MSPTARRWGRALVELLYPLHCAACGTPLERGVVCPSCAAQVQPLAPPRCPRGAKDVDVDGGACFGVYEEGKVLARLIQQLKYHGDRKLVPWLGRRLVQAAAALPWPQAVTYVPLHRKRLRRRGFNQAELLARWVGQALGLTVEPLLTKVKDTPPQASLRRAQRLVNLAGAFRAAPSAWTHLWLVDDVRTTGATLSTCARALKDRGARRVEGLVLAAAAEGKGKDAG